MDTSALNGETVAPEVWSRVDDTEEGRLGFLTHKPTLGRAESVTLCSWCRFSSGVGLGSGVDLEEYIGRCKLVRDKSML